MIAPDFAAIVSALAGEAGISLRGLGLAWARVLPAVTIVPAFGLAAFPAVPRFALGLAMAAALAPALQPVVSTKPFLVEFAVELLRGLPVAVSAAIALWAATMAGGLMDNVRGARELSALPNVEAGTTPFGALLSMLVAIVFLQSGGAERIAIALAEPSLSLGVVEAIARRLTNAVTLAVSVGAPMLVAATLVELGFALVARAAVPAFLEPVLAPLRSFTLLSVSALLLDRIAEFLALHAAALP